MGMSVSIVFSGGGRELTAVARGSGAVLVELALGVMLGSQVPMHIHGTQTLLPVGLRDGNASRGVDPAAVPQRHVGPGLLQRLHDVADLALMILEPLRQFHARARILARRRPRDGHSVSALDGGLDGIVAPRPRQGGGIGRRGRGAGVAGALGGGGGLVLLLVVDYRQGDGRGHEGHRAKAEDVGDGGTASSSSGSFSVPGAAALVRSAHLDMDG
mmetsp:Transcript_34230/g.102463  ORF Transcript_34230/g.102463 Transcript_34230/m.102463 type:complete len:215 (+) Transcript_34230:957-1601(+)